MPELLYQECNPIAASFSRAAHSYDSAAQLQQWSGLELMRRLPRNIKPQRWLDLGCGTGFFTRRLSATFPQTQAYAVDISQGMLHYARQLHPDARYISGSAERLPIADNSLDLIFSNLALQWCTDLSQVLHEAARALRPDGVLAFTSLADGSLSELKRSWRAVDDLNHVNEFRSFSHYQQLCQTPEFHRIQVQCVPIQQHFNSVKDLSRNLRQLGAQHVQAGRASGLTSRQSYQQLCQAYEQFRQPQGLPASWQVIFILLQRHA